MGILNKFETNFKLRKQKVHNVKMKVLEILLYSVELQLLFTLIASEHHHSEGKGHHHHPPSNTSAVDLCLHNTDCVKEGEVCCKSHLCCSISNYLNEMKECHNPGTNIGCGKDNTLLCCGVDNKCRMRQDCGDQKEFIGNLNLLHFVEFQEVSNMKSEAHTFTQKLMAQHDSESTVLKLIISLLLIFVVAAIIVGIGASVYCVTLYYQRQSQNYMKLGDHNDSSSIGSFQPYQFASTSSGKRADG